MSDDWTPEQQALFTRLFRHMSANPEVFRHHGAPPIDPEHWDVICHNAAWLAADMLEADGRLYRHFRFGRQIGVEPTSSTH